MSLRCAVRRHPRHGAGPHSSNPRGRYTPVTLKDLAKSNLKPFNISYSSSGSSFASSVRFIPSSAKVNGFPRACSQSGRLSSIRLDILRALLHLETKAKTQREAPRAILWQQSPPASLASLASPSRKGLFFCMNPHLCGHRDVRRAAVNDGTAPVATEGQSFIAHVNRLDVHLRTDCGRPF